MPPDGKRFSGLYTIDIIVTHDPRLTPSFASGESERADFQPVVFLNPWKHDRLYSRSPCEPSHPFRLHARLQNVRPPIVRTRLQ